MYGYVRRRMDTADHAKLYATYRCCEWQRSHTLRRRTATTATQVSLATYSAQIELGSICAACCVASVCTLGTVASVADSPYGDAVSVNDALINVTDYNLAVRRRTVV